MQRMVTVLVDGQIRSFAAGETGENGGVPLDIPFGGNSAGKLVVDSGV